MGRFPPRQLHRPSPSSDRTIAACREASVPRLNPVRLLTPNRFATSRRAPREQIRVDVSLRSASDVARSENPRFFDSIRSPLLSVGMISHSRTRRCLCVAHLSDLGSSRPRNRLQGLTPSVSVRPAEQMMMGSCSAGIVSEGNYDPLTTSAKILDSSISRIRARWPAFLKSVEKSGPVTVVDRKPSLQTMVPPRDSRSSI